MKQVLLLLDNFINPKILQSNDFLLITRARFILMLLLVAFVLLIYPNYLELQRFGLKSGMTLVNGALMTCLVASTLFLYYKDNLDYSIYTWLLGSWIAIFGTSYLKFGIYDPALWWLMLAPPAAVLFSGARTAVVVTLVSTSGILVCGLIEPRGLLNYTPPEGINDAEMMTFQIAAFIFSGVLAVAVHYTIDYSHKQLLAAQKQLLDEKQKVFQSQKLASLGEMAGGISHEINNPLAIAESQIVLAHLKIKGGQATVESLAETLTKIDQTLKRAITIIHGLKNFSRDAEHDEKTMVDPKSIIEGTLRFCTESLKQNEIDLRLSYDHGDNTIFIQPVQISQVILNLINNAIDALAEQKNRWIEIKTQWQSDSLLISVTDSGKGIKDENSEKIFEPFYTTKPEDKGTGLGLSVSMGIMRIHGGKIEINPDAQHTQFVLTFPSQSITDIQKKAA